MKLGDCAGYYCLFVNVQIFYNEIFFKLEIYIAYEFGVTSLQNKVHTPDAYIS